MGQYYKENYTERVKVDDVELPPQCHINISGGGKVLVIHNRIKEQTGWKDRTVTITGRLEGEDEDDINSQIKDILELGQKQEALTIISRETDYYNLKKIVLEDDPQITTIEGFDLSREFFLTGIEDQEKEDNLAKKKEEDKKAITDPKKKKKEKLYIVKQGDSLSKIAAKHYGSHTRWRIIYNANRDKIKNPNLIYPGQELNTMTENMTEEKEYTVKKGDTYTKIAKDHYGEVSYRRLIMKATNYEHLSERDIIIIPSLMDYDEQVFAKKYGA